MVRRSKRLDVMNEVAAILPLSMDSLTDSFHIMNRIRGRERACGYFRWPKPAGTNHHYFSNHTGQSYCPHIFRLLQLGFKDWFLKLC